MMLGMATTRVIFVAFAIEDVRQRDLLRGQSLNTRSPFEYVDMSVKEPYDNNWKERVRTRIRRSDGVIALVSRNTLTSAGEKWEIQCAKEEGTKMIGLWVYSDDRTRPQELSGYRTLEWTWQGIADFVNSL